MSSGNRTVKYENLLKTLRKHYKPLADPPERTILEHLLYSCCLEDARVEQADEGFAKLQQTYFDWNEVRVTTVAELAEALKALPFPMQAASRIKQCLQSIFETRYQYDIDDMKKANLSKATSELEAWKGMSPFAVAYVSQHALGGHSIPPSALICDAMWQCEILAILEVPKNALPGIERAIPKTKGIEFAGLMHQFATDLYNHPKSAAPLAVLKDMGVSYKSKPKPVEEPKVSKVKVFAGKQPPAKTPSAKTPSAKTLDPESSKESASKQNSGATPKVSPSAVPSSKSSAGQKTDKANLSKPLSNEQAKHSKSASKPLSALVSKVTDKTSKPSESDQPSGKSPSGKPASSKPASSKPASSKPESSKPESSKPESSKPASKQESSKPASKQESSKPASKQASSKPASSKPASSKPASKQESSKPASKQESSKPASGKQESSKSASSKPESSKSASSKPESSKPASSKPASKQESSKPASSKPEKSALDKGKTDKGKTENSKAPKKDVKETGKASSKDGHGSVGASLAKRKPR